MPDDTAARATEPRDPVSILARAQLLNSIGDGAFYVTSVLFFARVVGLTPTQIGLGLTLGWGAGFLAGVPLGHLADCRGPRGTAVVLALTTALAVSALLVVGRTGSFPMFLAVICGYGVSQTGLSAVRQALLAGLVSPVDRTRVRAMLQSRLNVGLAVGAGLGGLALAVDRPWAYLTVLGLDALGFLCAAMLLYRLPVVPVVPSLTDGRPRLEVLRDLPYATIAGLNAVLVFYMPVLGFALPLWITQQTTAPPWMVAVLFLLNTSVVVACQVRVARRVDGLSTAARFMALAGAVMFVACAVFAVSGRVGSPVGAAAILIAGTALLVGGEMLLASGAWEISFALAPADRHGQYQGLFGSGVPIARMLGPFVLTALVLTGGPWGWVALGGIFLLAGAAAPAAVRWVERTRPELIIGKTGISAAKMPDLR